MPFGNIGKAIGAIGDAVNLGTSIVNLAQEGTTPSNRASTNAVRIRVRDAKAAGIHPLYALGAAVGPTGAPGSGPSVGDVLGDLGHNVAGIGDSQARKTAAKQAADESASRVRVNESQAMLNEARSRSLLQEMRANPTIMREVLDPSYVEHPQTGRLSMWRDSSGKWHRVDTSVAPAEVLEREYGEVSELQGIHRLLKALPEFGGALDWPSFQDLRRIITNP